MRTLGLEIAAVTINNRDHGYQHVESVKSVSDEIVGLLRRRRSGSTGPGYLVLDTCSRFEIYMGGSGEMLNDLLIGVQRDIRDLVSIDPKIYRDRDLLTHMLRVLSGAESLAPFELDIVSQARASMDRALSDGSLDKHLNAIFREAIEASIDIRRSLGISGSVGIPEAAVMVAKEILGGLAGKRIAIFGTGEVARRIAGMLRGEGVDAASIVGRSYRGAEAIARIFPGGSAHLISEASRVIGESDLVFLATSSREPVVGLSSVETNSNGIFIDLGNPRNVDPGARALLRGRYLWLEDLEVFSRKILKDLYERLGDLDIAIQKHLIRLEERLVLENIKLGINGYARLLERIRREEVERAVKAFGLDQREKEVMDLVTSSIINKALGALGSFVEDQASHRSFTSG